MNDEYNISDFFQPLPIDPLNSLQELEIGALRIDQDRVQMNSQAEAVKDSLPFDLDNSRAFYDQLKNHLARLDSGKNFQPIISQEGKKTLAVHSYNEGYYAVVLPASTKCPLIQQEATFFSAVLSQLPDGVFMYTANGNLVYANEAASGFLSVQSRKGIGKNIFEIASLPRAISLLASIKKVTESNETIEISDFIKEGSKRSYLEVTLSPFACKSKTHCCALGIARDISDKKELKDRLRSLRKRRELIYQQLPGIIWAMDENLCYTHLSGSSLDKVNLEQLEHNNLRDALEQDESLSVEQIEEVIAAHKKCLLGNNNRFNLWYKGTHFEVSMQPLRDTNDGIIGIIGLSMDTTRLAQVQQKLEDSEHRLHEAQRIANVGSFEWDIQQKYFTASPQLLRIKGMDENVERLSEDEAWSMVHPDDRERVRKTFDTAVESAQDFETTYRITLESGDVRHVLVRGNVCTDNGKAIRIVGTELDISGRVRAETQLKQARKIAEAANQAKTDFLASISHEVRTPLTPIMGAIELLRERIKDPESTEFMGIIEDSSKRLLNLINDILDIAKIEAGKVRIEKESFPLSKLVERCIQQAGFTVDQKKVKLKTDCANNLPERIYSDFGRLSQIINNLLSNSAKFTREGSITLKVEYDKDDEILYFSVIDTGVGIEPAKQKHIFAPFYQVLNADRRGTGLGLAISATLAEALDAKLSVDSQMGKGSTFTLQVPIKQPAKQARKKGIGTPRAKATKKTASKPLRILLAEDDPTNRVVATEMLGLLGYEAECVENGAEARKAALENLYDLIIMDIQMPIMDGLTASKQLLSQAGFKTPIVGFSAHAFDEQRKKCLKAGMVDFIVKPASIADFERAIAKARRKG